MSSLCLADITDPVTLLPFENVQITKCGHRYSLPIALKIFGQMKNETCATLSPCPLCRALVTQYKPDPDFQKKVNQFVDLENKKNIPEQKQISLDGRSKQFTVSVEKNSSINHTYVSGNITVHISVNNYSSTPIHFSSNF